MAAGNPALKEYYDDHKVAKEIYEDNPTFASIPKDENSVGKYYPQPVLYGGSQGRSATFSNAQGNQSAMVLAEFMVTRKKDYSIATIDNELLQAASSDTGTFVKFAGELIDVALQELGNSQSLKMFRSGTGTVGTISSISSGVITLTNPADVVNFQTNQTLQANATDGGTPRTALGYVISRSIKNGTVTVASSAQGGSAATPTSWTGSDSLLVQGDNNNCMSGFAAWLPTTDPTGSDNFYAVNRSVDYRLFGVYYDGSGQSTEEAVIDQSMLLGREGSKPTHLPTNFGTYASLIKALGTRRQYEDMVTEAGIGFRAVLIDGAKGPLKCYADRSCQPKTAFMLQMDTWKLISVGPVPQTLRYEDRLEMLRVFNADAAEFRSAAYSNMVCKAPVKNGQLLLAS